MQGDDNTITNTTKNYDNLNDLECPFEPTKEQEEKKEKCLLPTPVTCNNKILKSSKQYYVLLKKSPSSDAPTHGNCYGWDEGYGDCNHVDSSTKSCQNIGLYGNKIKRQNMNAIKTNPYYIRMQKLSKLRKKINKVETEIKALVVILSENNYMVDELYGTEKDILASKMNEYKKLKELYEALENEPI